MLRCEGCGVMHHPGCWVTNDGCATQTRHKVSPLAQAYATSRIIGAAAPHPGEGTRTAPRVVLPNEHEPLPFRGQPAVQKVQEQEREPDSWPVIGGHPVPNEAQRRWNAEPVVPASPPRRYVPPSGEQGARKPLPKIYNRHRILGYWYVPAAIGVAVIVALGVIWGAEQLFGSGEDQAAASPTPSGSNTQAPGVAQDTPAATTPAASVTTAPGANTPAASAGKFRPGQALVVAGAGAGENDCLNVRVAPGTGNDAIVCLKDGSPVTATGGPETAGGLTWWKVETALGEGWAAEEYLVARP